MASTPLTAEPTAERSAARPLNLQGWAKVAILMGLALYFVFILATGSVSNYVNERFSWLSYVAVALFFGLGLASTYSLLRRDEAGATLGSGGHIREPSWPVLLIVSLPLVLGTFIPSQPLGAEAINGNLSTSAANMGGATAFARDPLDRNILDWLRVFSTEASPAALNGEPADIIGFVYREVDMDGGDQFLVARFAVSCCVADANAFALPVAYAGATDLQDGAWVRVRGTFQAAEFRGVTTPILMAETVAVVDQPEHPYLYP